MKHRRILSALLSAMVLLSLSITGAAAAAGGIQEVAVTMTAPQVGQTLPNDAQVASPADAVITKLRWSGDLDNGKPKMGAACSANITIEIKPDSTAVFARRSAVSVTVNGQKASLVGYTEKKLDVIAAFYFRPDTFVYTPEKAEEENYDTFDYRAYANVYPDLKAAYGYDAEKLYAHYVNFGKAEGRVGTFIGGDNPKTNAPIYGSIPGTTAAPLDPVQANVPATLLAPLPPRNTSEQPKWIREQVIHPCYASNAKMVAEYYSTSSYMTSDRAGYLKTEPVEYWTLYTLRDELLDRYKAVMYSDPDYQSSTNLGGSVYNRAMDSDTKILFHWSDYTSGKSTFAAPPADPGKPGQPPAKTVGGFSDVTEKDYFADPVVWAVEKEITGGTGNGMFSPGQTCTQAQILTFLWRAKGSPEPKGTVEIPGADTGAYYYKAALWAMEQGMIGSEFGANDPCTRAMAVTYIWKQAGSPEAPDVSFTDVPAGADYAQAVAWALEKGVTGGTGSNQFSPNNTCTRGQIVTFLYRAFAG